MKTLVAGAALIAMAPSAATALVLGATSSTGQPPDPCVSATSGTTMSACVSGSSRPAASPFAGPDGLVGDPTTAGRITRRMLHTYIAVQQAFNGWPWPISCWDPHLWNPTSDHPLGRACDFTVGHIGRRPSPDQHALGWQLARWTQASAAALGIRYVIWDGHIWSASRARKGWRRYNGGGIYDPASITGGHYDHVHISVQP